MKLLDVSVNARKHRVLLVLAGSSKVKAALQVGVVADDQAVLATEFDAGLLQVRPGARRDR